MAFNRFGAVYTSVISLYVGTAAADYGGQTVIEEAIDRACDQILAAMPEAVHNQLMSPSLALIVQRATAGQTTATLPLLPLIAGTALVWVGQPSQFQDKPRLNPTIYSGDPGLLELDPSKFSVVTATGAITLTPGMSLNDQLYASWDVDATGASYSAPSLARLAVRGAAAELGSLLYSESDQAWQRVADLLKSFQDSLDQLSAGEWIPEEIRYLKWWKEVEKSSGAGAVSIRLPRA